METSAPQEEFKGPKTLFKLINPGGNPFGPGKEDRFKPSTGMGVCLVKSVPAAPTASAPTPAPAPAEEKTSPVAPTDGDAKIIARMEYLLKIDKRVHELEEENDLLLKMVNRIKAENESLRKENETLKAK